MPFFAGHYGAYGHDTVWYSDDQGKTYHAAKSNLTKMDEAQIVRCCLRTQVVRTYINSKRHQQ